MEKKKSFMITAFKIFISILLIMTIVFIIPSILWGVYVDWIFVMVLSLALSLFGTHHYKETTMEIPIEDKNSFSEYVRERLDPGLWKIIKEENDIFTIKPRFDRPYSWIYKERITITLTEDHAIVKGSKVYIDRMEPILKGKNLLRNNKILRYVGTVIMLLLLMTPTLLHLEVIDIFALRKAHHQFRVRNIEKITFEENLSLGNTVNNINNYGMVVGKEDHIFYIKGSSGIYKADRDFNYEESVLIKSSGIIPWYLNIVEDWLFYREGKAIKRMKTDGGKTDTIFNLGYTQDLHILDNWIYFIYQSEDFEVYKMTVNGENLQKIIDISVSHIAIYDNKLYYSYTLDGVDYFKYMDLDSQEHEMVANLFTRDMILEDNIVYFINYHNSKLYQYDLLTEELKPLTNDEVGKFTKVDNNIYFIKRTKEEHHQGKGLYKLNLDDHSKVMLNNDWFWNDFINVTEDWIIYESTDDYRRPAILKRMSLEGNEAVKMEVD